ncbi:MAG: hypothetical protein CL722_05285 [Chloroflexi bacterium]|jgi:cytolysin (calcineurin-like family phosphatase)|nr:hypothetical protein [Chloroflexota bacterium]|tara:strand:- start:84 stop:1007 length:924 start_codon:yes stop_codon:yes gene_type:complete
MKAVLSYMIFYIASLASQNAEDLTFFIASDTHYGKNKYVGSFNIEIINAMNEVPGMYYPDSIGGNVDIPFGVVICGDLTENGKKESFVEFIDHYGLNGNKKLLYPVYEGFGNHDGNKNGYVRNAIKIRNLQRKLLGTISPDSLHYSWNWGDIHFVNLNSYPANIWDPNCEWCHYFKDSFREPQFSLDYLKNDLEQQVGITGKPVVLFFHYGFDEWGKKWWTVQDQDTFYNVIKDYNIKGIFHGHTHEVDHYYWKGTPVWCVGSTQKDEGPGEFLTVNITSEKMVVGIREINRWKSFYIIGNNKNGGK